MGLPLNLNPMFGGFFEGSAAARAFVTCDELHDEGAPSEDQVQFRNEGVDARSRCEGFGLARGGLR